MTNGITQLGYLGFEVSDIGAWERLLTEVIGLGVAERRADGSLSFRMDGHAHRILVRPGPADDLTFVGWQTSGADAFASLVDLLHSASVDVSLGTAEEASLRKVAAFARFRDPAGVPVEIFHGPEMAKEPFQSSVARSGFVADDEGLGHVVVTANTNDESLAFYRDKLGFRLSDRIIAEIYGYHADMLFLHANRRHHSLAFGGRMEKTINHFMIEVRSLDDVGLAFDRTMRARLQINHTIGRHPNDRMISFYAQTPSGFQFEVGFGGREVDDATWEPATYNALSEWGHHPPVVLVPRKRPASAS